MCPSDYKWDGMEWIATLIIISDYTWDGLDYNSNNPQCLQMGWFGLQL